MAYFLAGVGNAEILKKNKDGIEELFATAKTLTDSSITIGVSAEDIRAGQGAKLYGKYFHTSTFDLKMTDAMFKMEYIAANVGAELEWGGEVFKDETLKSGTDKKIKVADAKPFTSGSTIYAYAKLPEEEFYKTYTVDVEDNTIEVPEASKDYCVKYLYTNDNARKLTVKANFTPDTLSVMLTSNLYAGDDKNPATGTKVGTVTIKVPRFLLSGSQELSMNMTGASTTPFEGSALASNAEGCDGEGIYAEIIEIIEGKKWIDNVQKLLIENEDDLESGDIINVYSISDNAIKKIPWENSSNDYYITTKLAASYYVDSYGRVKYLPETFVFNQPSEAFERGEGYYKENICLCYQNDENVLATTDVRVYVKPTFDWKNVKELYVENANNLKSGDVLNIYAITYDGAKKKINWGKTFREQGIYLTVLYGNRSHAYCIDMSTGRIKTFEEITAISVTQGQIVSETLCLTSVNQYGVTNIVEKKINFMIK